MTELLELGLVETVDKEEKSTGSSGNPRLGILEVEQIYTKPQVRTNF